MEKLKLVRASSKDALTLATILTESTQIKLGLGDNSWGSKPYSEEEARRLIESYPTFLAYSGKEVVGTITLQWDDEPVWGVQELDAGYIHRLAVKAAYKGQGVGEKMLRWADEQAAQNDRKFLRLDCDADNLRLCAYYLKQGFAKVGEKRSSADEHVIALFERPVAAK